MKKVMFAVLFAGAAMFASCGGSHEEAPATDTTANAAAEEAASEGAAEETMAADTTAMDTTAAPAEEMAH
ncbi:MAG: hypothetical protein R2850_10635 [Bacteroidia bacterium]